MKNYSKILITFCPFTTVSIRRLLGFVAFATAWLKKMRTNGFILSFIMPVAAGLDTSIKIINKKHHHRP